MKMLISVLGRKMCLYILVLVLFIFVCLFFKTGLLSAALVPILELTLVDKAGIKLTEILLPLPPEC